MDKPQKIPKVAKVKNKAPAEIQITAEQLLREAKERDLEIVPPPPKQKISDPDELKDYQHRKRKAFEDNIRKNRMVISNWIKYAQWEESQKQVDRARSIYERALDVDHRNITLWLKYTELEMRNRQVNHARNLWDRAVTILPRANQFWYKYTYMEEMLENIAGARQVFERWMEWEPDEQAWLTYIKFELRYGEVTRARDIYSRFVLVHPDVKNWIRFARFEEQNSFISGARKVFERAVEFFGDESLDEKLFIAFAKFEEGQREHERARVIYKYALDHIPKDRTQEIYKAYTIHEKKYGDRAGIEDVIVSKRKFQYEEEVNANPNNYDAWFDYLRLLEDEGNADLIRETYERAIANIPPTKEKQFWRRYIYLWIYYAVFEELEMEDAERTREVYKACLEVIPHKLFTFSKLWLYMANFEIRQKNLTGARKILGAGLGICPKDKLFRGYIDLELQLREFDRCRILYQKFLEFRPENCITWMRFAELESLLGDLERARAIYELAISQPRLDMPELVWKAYIDFEVGQGEREKVRLLHERLLERTMHVKVWMNYAQFESATGDSDSIAHARAVFERGNQALRHGEKEERVMLLEAWREFENQHGDEESRQKLASKLPRRAKKRVRMYNDEGLEEGWEEVLDYIFPEDEAAKPNLKLLEKAKAWKKAMEEKRGGSNVPDNEEERTGSAEEGRDNENGEEEREDAGKGVSNDNNGDKTHTDKEVSYDDKEKSDAKLSDKRYTGKEDSYNDDKLGNKRHTGKEVSYDNEENDKLGDKRRTDKEIPNDYEEKDKRGDKRRQRKEEEKDGADNDKSTGSDSDESVSRDDREDKKSKKREEMKPRIDSKREKPKEKDAIQNRKRQEKVDNDSNESTSSDSDGSEKRNKRRDVEKPRKNSRMEKDEKQSRKRQVKADDDSDDSTSSDSDESVSGDDREDKKSKKRDGKKPRIDLKMEKPKEKDVKQSRKRNSKEKDDRRKIKRKRDSSSDSSSDSEKERRKK